MTQVVIGDIIPYTQATATGGQTVFGTNWTANVASDVVVYLTPAGGSANDVTQLLTYPSHYSVAFVGGSLQVQVTLVSAASAGDIVTITRQTPADRVNLYSNTNFLPTMLNNDFGILTLVDQQAQLVNQLIGPRYNYSAVITDVVDTILPILGANQAWVKNSANTAIVPLTISSGGSITGTINIGSPNEIAYYAGSGNTISGLPTANNGVLVTSNSGVPSISRTLPSGLTIPQPLIGGVTDGSDAASGLVGEYISSNVAQGSAVSLVSNVAKNITSISLTAGDWDVRAHGATLAGAGTTTTAFNVGVSLVSDTLTTQSPSAALAGINNLPSNPNQQIGLPTGTCRISVSTTTTVYVVMSCVFAVSTLSGYGWIAARRVR